VLASQLHREEEVSSFWPGEKFALTWFPWPKSWLSLSVSVEGGLAGDQREGAYYGGWVLLCLYYLCADDTVGDPSLYAGG
jgi:hypothetical protein